MINQTTGQGQVTLFIFLSIISQQVSAVTDEHSRRATSRQMYCTQTCDKLVSDQTKLTTFAIFCNGRRFRVWRVIC